MKKRLKNGNFWTQKIVKIPKTNRFFCQNIFRYLFQIIPISNKILSSKYHKKFYDFDNFWSCHFSTYLIIWSLDSHGSIASITNLSSSITIVKTNKDHKNFLVHKNKDLL